MLVSKAQFIYFVNKYKEAFEEQENFQDALRPYFDFPLCKYRDNLVDAYASMLVAISECEEEDDIFNFFITENVDKTIKVQDTVTGEKTTYDCSTAEGLYDYLYYMYHHGD